MVKIEEIQQYGTSLQYGFQAIATAYGDYTKKSFEDSRAFVEKLTGAKSLDKALEMQTEYAKSAYETFVAEFTEDRRTLYRSRQADLQAAGKPGHEVHAGSCCLIFDETLKSKARPLRPGFFICLIVFSCRCATTILQRAVGSRQCRSC